MTLKTDVAVEENAIYKTFRAEIKEVDAQAGLLNMVIPMSTGSVDRDEEIIEPAAFKKQLKEFMKRPILLSSHMYGDLRKQIGEFRNLKVTDEGLMANGLEYYVGRGNEEADWGFYLASKGMAAFSVGFIPKQWEKIDEEQDDTMWGNRRYTELELLEISQVVVPSNRDAIQGVRGKAVGDKVTTALLDEVEKDLADESVTKPEETDDYIRIPIKDEEGKHTDHRIRTITVSDEKGIKAFYCGECKVIITYLFSKDDEYDWTMGSAQEWVDEHAKSYKLVEVTQWPHHATSEGETEPQFAIQGPLPGLGHADEEPTTGKKVSQQQLQDDIDYLHKAIIENGMNVDTFILAVNMASGIIMRLTGADIPDEIQSKVGAVLNAKNKGRLHQIRQLAQEVLDSAAAAEEDGKQVEPPKLEPLPVIEMAKQRAHDVAEVASLVVAQLQGKRIPK